MVWRYLIKQLALPPGSLILLGLLGVFLWQRRPRFARVLVLLSLLGVWLLSTPHLVQWLSAPLETDPPLAVQQLDLSTVDAIVVLGGGRVIYPSAWGGQQPSVMAMQRLRYAAKLERQTRLSVVVSGGLHFGEPPSEAQLMAEVLVNDYHLPVPAIEGKSRTTWENAVEVAKQLLPENKRIILVTHSWHMKRSAWSFKAQGFDVIAAPVAPYQFSTQRPLDGWLPEAQAFWQNRQLINEWIGRLVYALGLA